MSNYARQAVKDLMADKVSDFNTKVDFILKDKLLDHCHAEKIRIGQTMFQGDDNNADHS